MAKPLQRFSSLEPPAHFDADGIITYRGVQVQRHFVRYDYTRREPIYEYRIVGYPTVYDKYRYVTDEIDYMIHQRGLHQESC